MPPEKVLRVQIEVERAADLQVTLVRLPGELPEVTLDADLLGADSRRATITIRHDAGDPVHWQLLSWERETLPQTKTNDSRNAVVYQANEVFTNTTTYAHRPLVSDPVDLTGFEGSTVVFKLQGIDPAGRPVAAWGQLQVPEDR